MSSLNLNDRAYSWIRNADLWKTRLAVEMATAAHMPAMHAHDVWNSIVCAKHIIKPTPTEYETNELTHAKRMRHFEWIHFPDQTWKVLSTLTAPQ